MPSVTFLGSEKSARSFSDRSFFMDVRAGCLCANTLFQDLEGLTEVFGRMSAGISGPKLPLWAEFSFLISAYCGLTCLSEDCSMSINTMQETCFTLTFEGKSGSLSNTPCPLSS